MALDRRRLVAALYDCYGPLLTERQRDCLELYHHADLSLGEIAAEVGTSRQAVHDLLRRGEQALMGYEARLGWWASSRRRLERLRGLAATLAELEEALAPLPPGGPAQLLSRARELAARLIEEEVE